MLIEPAAFLEIDGTGVAALCQRQAMLRGL
jgi:hypothetical protein